MDDPKRAFRCLIRRVIATLASDVRAAWTGLTAGRWSSLTAAATLALGIGACLTGALVAYGGLLRTLPVLDERALVAIGRFTGRRGSATG